MKVLHRLYSRMPGKIQRVSGLYLKLRSKFTLFFFLLVMLPTVIFIAVSYYHTRSLVEENTYHAALTSISQEMDSIRKYINSFETAVHLTADALESNGSMLLIKSVNPLTPQLKRAIESNLTPGQRAVLSAAYVFADNEMVASYGSDADIVTIINPASQQWFFETFSNPDAVQILGPMQRFYAEGKSKVVFSMAKSLINFSDKKRQALLLFDFDSSMLTDFLGSADESALTKRERLILDLEGNILFSRNLGKLTSTADEAILDAIGSASSDRGFKRILYNNEGFYMTHKRYPDPGWIFIDLNPVTGTVDKLWLRSPLMTFCLIFLPVMLFIYLIVSFKIINPINELTSVISDYENQLPGVGNQPPLLRRNTSDAGVNVISDIDFLIDKIYSIKLSQKEAQLNSLQNQINPHFLYNTLESIRGAALYHGIHDIAAMSKALSLLFRYSINERVLVSIKEELQHLENYMSIQNFRYENKFELLYSIPPELMTYKILKLTLQPLIENSIKHGLEMKLGRGTIKIEILALENNMKIQITDNGLGMHAKKIDELNRSLSSDRYTPGCEGDIAGTGIGVRNVNSRIKLYFGEQYGLKFMDAPIGTTVEITLPTVKEN